MRAAFLFTCLAWMGSIALASTSGCANASKRDGFEGGQDAGTLVTDDASTTLPSDDDAGDFGNTEDAGSKEGPREVYGHSKDVLYRLSPDTKDVKEIGTFDGCGVSIVDIALDEGSNLYATSYTAIYRVDKATAKCTKVADGDENDKYPDSLSFVPKGTLDADEEALVGYVAADYVRIDRTTGVKTVEGNLGPKAAGLISSGDIVSVEDGPTFLTVKPANRKGCTDKKTMCCTADCLVEIDPSTGEMTKNWGPIGYLEVFGLSFWGGSVYGFDKTGNLFEITFSGDKIKTTDIPISDGPSDLSFWGAGSATSAPLQPN